jgi:hypothetical protein
MSATARPAGVGCHIEKCENAPDRERDNVGGYYVNRQ